MPITGARLTCMLLKITALYFYSILVESVKVLTAIVKTVKIVTSSVIIVTIVIH
jgi:hypothetical protein